MAGIQNNVDMLTKQLSEINAQKAKALKNVETNETTANKIQEQVTRTTADEEQQAKLYDIVTDNEKRDVASAGKNHKETIDELEKQRKGLKEPEKPASDASNDVKSKYESDLKAYKEQSAILDDEFKAENKRYEEELKQIEKEAKQAKKDAQKQIEAKQLELKELSSQKDANSEDIKMLQQEIVDLQKDIATKEQEVKDAKQAKETEKTRQKENGGIDGNTNTDKKAEKADKKADKKALKAAKKDLKNNGETDVKMDKKAGTITYTDKQGFSHTVTVSGNGKGDDANYKIANSVSGSTGASYTRVSDLGFKDGKADIKRDTGSIRTDNHGNTTIISQNDDGSTTVNAKRKIGNLSLEESTYTHKNGLRLSATTSEIENENGSIRTTRTDVGGTTQMTQVITNKDGSTTKVDHSSADNSRTEVTEKDGKTTNFTSFNNDKSKTSVNYRDDGATTMVNYGADGKETTGLISRSENGKTYDQGIEYKDGKAYTSTKVKLNETIDDVLKRMGFDKKDYQSNDEDKKKYDDLKDKFIKANDVRTSKRNVKYFLAGQEVKVPIVDLDKYKPTEGSTEKINGKAQEDEWARRYKKH